MSSHSVIIRYFNYSCRSVNHLREINVKPCCNMTIMHSFFFITVILCISIPLLIRFIWNFRQVDKSLDAVDEKGQKKLYTVTSALMEELLDASRYLMNEPLVQTFEPYQILGITRSASERDIKKAYRLLSLKYHPDRNPNDPSSAAKFLIIQKAVNALTNDTAKENMKKYGNPDGQSTMEIGIGLPNFLIDEKNQAICLFYILTVLLLIIPLLFILRYQKQKLYYSNGVEVETIHFMSYFMSEEASLDTLLEFLIVSAEARKYKLIDPDSQKYEEISQVSKLTSDYQQEPHIHRIYLLLQAHINGLHHLLTPTMQKDLKSFLKLCFPIIDCMIEIAIVHAWYDVVNLALTLSRCLVHGLPLYSNSFQQLFGDDYAKVENKLPTTFKSLLHFTKDQLEAICDNLDPIQRNNVLAIFDTLPKRNMKIELKVLEEEEIVENDVVTVFVEVEQLHIPEGCVTGPIHSSYLPNTHYETTWLFIKNLASGTVLMHKHFTPINRKHVEQMQFMAPKAGHYTLEFLLSSDSFSDIEIQKQYSFTVLHPEKADRPVFLHKSDMELGNDVSLISQFLKPEQNGNPDFSDSDDE